MFARKHPRYPSPLFQILCTLQLIASGLVVVFFYVAWANVRKTQVLKEDLGAREGTETPTELHAPWYFILLHTTAHLSFVCTVILFLLNTFNMLYPPIGLVVNFVLTFLYIAGVAGVAAFSFALNLAIKCDSGIGCVAYKIAFDTAHVAGLLTWFMMLLDAYAWGQRTGQAGGDRVFYSESGAESLPTKANAYETTQH